ncbi:hypothetical protein J6Z39_04610 [bacterium]|nr:hypothetical protein [bacterium]
MKKISILTLIAMAVFAFVGCSADDEEDLPTGADTGSTSGSDTGDTQTDTQADTSADTGETGNTSADTGSNPGSDTGDTPADTGDNTDTAGDTSADTGSTTTFCTPGTKICGSQPNAVYICNADGSAAEPEPVETCPEGYSCLNGNCHPGACLSGNGYEGCEFYTAKLNNMATGKDTFSVAFANANPEKTATIQFFKVTGEGTEEPIPNFEYCEQVVKSFLGMEYNDMDCKNHDSSFTITVPPQSTVMVSPTKEQRMLEGTAASFLSFHIVSDLPIIAYQFNPYYNNSYSNDASLLFPTTRLGTEYYVASYESQKGYDGNGVAYFTVIGAFDTNVELEITPTAAIPAGNGIPGTAAGVPMTVELKAGEVLNIENAAKFDDFTGTKVACKKPNQNCAPFVVFGGHACAYVPRNKGYCDHLEHQLMPVSRWGRNYVVVKTKPRSYARDVVRIIAGFDGTDVTVTILDDNHESGPTQTVSLNAGQKYEFDIIQHDTNSDWFQPGTANITATQPIEVVQYLSGAEDISYDCADDSPGSSHSGCNGDPAMAIVPPVEQYRQEYFFFSTSLDDSSNSSEYTENYVSVVTDEGSEIALDESTPEPRMSGKIVNTEKHFYIYDLDDYFMSHHLTCSKPCGIQVYGWSMDISYMYPGGLDMKMLQ